MDPIYLLTGVEKLTRFNVEARRNLIRLDEADDPFMRMKEPLKIYDHPSLKERKKFAGALIRLADQGVTP